MTISLERIAQTLPPGFAELEADAKGNGHGHMTRLAAEFANSPDMFHAIFAGYRDGVLAGIGAITGEPARTSEPIWRMRRLYVHRSSRRHQVARTIVEALLQEAPENVATVTVHAGSDGAARFWEAIGFCRVLGLPWSHQAVRTPLARSVG